MSLFEAVVDIDTLYKPSGHLILKSNENDIPAACFATRPEPPGWKGDGGSAGRSKGSREEARQGGGRKNRSVFQTKLKSRGCNSSDLKTILYS